MWVLRSTLAPTWLYSLHDILEDEFKWNTHASILPPLRKKHLPVAHDSRKSGGFSSGSSLLTAGDWSLLQLNFARSFCSYFENFCHFYKWSGWKISISPVKKSAIWRLKWQKWLDQGFWVRMPFDWISPTALEEYSRLQFIHWGKKYPNF